MSDKKQHWENVYHTQPHNRVSWYEPIPETSLSIIKRFKLPKDAAIIDIGGGDSLLADYLLMLGYTNITVLDISEKAIERAKARLGDQAQQVTWLVHDVLTFTAGKKYDLPRPEHQVHRPKLEVPAGTRAVSVTNFPELQRVPSRTCSNVSAV